MTGAVVSNSDYEDEGHGLTPRNISCKEPETLGLCEARAVQTVHI